MIKSLNERAIFALGLLCLNTIYASQLLQMDSPFTTGEPGPSFLPSILCAFVYAATLRLAYLELFRKADSDGKSQTSLVIPKIHIVGPLFATAATILFILLFAYTNYLVATMVYTFLIAMFFNYEQNGELLKSMLYSALTSLAVTLFGWFFFVKVFDLYLTV